MKMSLAKEVFDPFAGPITKDPRKKGRDMHEGAVIDRTLNAVKGQVDVDFWHPGDERWFRYCSTDIELINRGEIDMVGEKFWVANFYPRVRFVDASTGVIYEEDTINKRQVLENMMPGMREYVDSKNPINRKDRRKHESDWKRSFKKALHKILRRGGKGEEIKY